MARALPRLRPMDMTRPDGNAENYFKWLGSDGNLYAPGESVWRM
ncbi:MAG: hypothetical protein V8Q32_02425 [Anaerotignum faecicola]